MFMMISQRNNFFTDFVFVFSERLGAIDALEAKRAKIEAEQSRLRDFDEDTDR